MIKFRCPHCARKIAVNDDAVGAVFACPSCAAFITVPVETAAEFRPLPLLAESPAPLACVTRDVGQADSVGADERFLQRARLLRDTMLQALLGQWRHLLDSQQAGADHVAVLEQRLTLVQQQYAARLNRYQARVAELESALAIRSQQTRRLQQENARLTQELTRATATAADGSGIDLRDVGAVLRV